MKLLYVLFFCIMSCLCGSEAGSWASFCCLKKISPIKRLPVKNVVDCKVQNAGLCPFDAIIIRTYKGKTLCYDPKAEWVTKNVVLKETNTCNMKKNSKGKKAGKGRKKGKRQKGSRSK